MMRIISRLIFVLLVTASLANHGWAQRGIPMPRPAPVPHVVPHVVPHGGQHGGNDSSEGFLPFVLGAGGVIGAGVVGFLGFNAWRNRTVARLLIIQIPPGEAPEDIRQAWVGLELPLSRAESEPERLRSVEVLSHVDPAIAIGYAINGRKAVAALAAQCPEAAAWWRQHAPHVVASGYRLFFPVEVCERVG